MPSRGFFNGLLKGKIQVVPRLNGWSYWWSTWDMDRELTYDPSSPIIFDDVPAYRYVFKCAYEMKEPLNAAVALRQAILETVRPRDYDLYVQALLDPKYNSGALPSGGYADPCEFDKQYNASVQLRNAQLQSVIATTALLTNLYVSAWEEISGVGTATAIVQAVLDPRAAINGAIDDIADLAELTRKGFELLASLPGKFSAYEPEPEGEAIDAIGSPSPPALGLLEEPAPANAPGSAARKVYARLKMNSVAQSVTRVWNVRKDVAAIKLAENTFADVGFVCRKGMNARAVKRPNGKFVLVLGKPQATVLSGVDTHVTKINSLVNEMVTTGRIANVDDMPVRDYLYIAQNRSVRTAVADATDGSRFAGISTKRPDIIGVYRKSDGTLGVDMFEVASGNQALDDLERALDDALETLPPGIERGEVASFRR